MRKITIIMMAGWSLMAALAADQQERKIMKLEETVVQASHVPKLSSEIPSTVTVINQEQIEKLTTIADDVSSVLERTVPGYGPSMQKMPGRGESLRGRNPLFLIDGIPQHNPLRDGQRDGHTIDLDFLQTIEVVHGSDAIQGAGATGGIVNMVTISPSNDQTWTNRLKLGTSTHDSFDRESLTYEGTI